jgi:DNA-binding transcriptional LysR family regulator
MDLSALQVFLAVAEERSFSRAAAKVHRTQPAVSQAVKRLENDLGEELLTARRRVALTDAGRAAELRPAPVRLAEETESAMRELRDLRRGRG